MMDIEPQIIHPMVTLTEQEKIIFFEYIFIKPIGVSSSAGRMMGETSTDNLNKGHIINAGVLYVLESGNMKILSTTGAVLLEKNIAFDINPSESDSDSI
jgi:hypothetical protein